MKTLTQLSERVKSLAIAYAPIKTGNLRKQIDTYNRPSGMIKLDTKTKSFSLRLDVSPPGAKYGKYWNDPDVSWQVKKGGKPENINFAQRALDDPSIKQLINQYKLEIRLEVQKEIQKAIREEFKDFK